MGNQEKSEREKMREIFRQLRKAPEAVASFECGSTRIELIDNGSFIFYLGGEKINGAYSRAEAEDGRGIDTRSAVRESFDCVDTEDVFGKGKMVVSTFIQNGMKLIQKISIYEERKHFTVQVVLADDSGNTRTRFLAPVETLYTDWSFKDLFLSLDQKMLLVPYDNDMWVRYESAVPRPGRRSYDVTAIYNENTLEGMIIGAIDFDTWKNAVAWSNYDARCLVAFCGAADGCTHDTLSHGVVDGTEVESARFVIGWYDDIRRGMEEYGRLCAEVTPRRPWSGKVPFGWNSYSGLGGIFEMDHWKQAGEFMHDELPEFGDEEGVTYVNMDGAFGMDLDRMKEIICEIHARGQKAGWYMGPCIAHRRLEQFMKLKGSDMPMSTIYLCDYAGNPLPPIDSSTPLDVTHPLWEQHVRTNIRDLLSLGIDYLKIDFLSHASLEGNFYNKEIKTGRQALNHAYRIMSEELSPEKAGREIFVSLSIAPLFPYFLGHARRSCCDTFGHYDDVRYALNALNFGWWTNGTIYQYADPDHCTLYHSMIDGRPATTEEESRSRYNTAVISGTVVLLSDNFGPAGDPEMIAAARARAVQFANNRQLNEIAAFGEAFVPATMKDGTASVYTLKHEGREFLAIFNFTPDRQNIVFEPENAGLKKEGVAYDLNRGINIEYYGAVNYTLNGYDSVIFELM